MFNDPKTVLALIKPSDKVLDVGGGAEVFPRANAIIDIIGYDERSPGPLKDMPEQFTKNDWYTGDICTPDIWKNFKDKEFDFVICSHVLEDVRDPLFVCRQLIRISKAGYIEVPSRFRECAKAHAFNAIAGWDHHRWIVDVDGDTVVFTFKNPWIHHFDYIADRRDALAHHAYMFTAIHWEGSFDYVEHSQKGAPLETENMFYFYKEYPYAKPVNTFTIRNVAHRGKTFQWVTEFKLPVEHVFSHEQIAAKHTQRLPAAEKMCLRFGGLATLLVEFLRKLRGKTNC
jgi:hypothetical protein